MTLLVGCVGSVYGIVYVSWDETVVLAQSMPALDWFFNFYHISAIDIDVSTVVGSPSLSKLSHVGPLLIKLKMNLSSGRHSQLSLVIHLGPSGCGWNIQWKEESIKPFARRLNFRSSPMCPHRYRTPKMDQITKKFRWTKKETLRSNDSVWHVVARATSTISIMCKTWPT